MSAHAYSEEQLVEKPAVGLFAALGWQTVSAQDEALGDGGTLGRATRAEVVIQPRLRAALQRLNPMLPPQAIRAAIDELTRDRSSMSLEAANREVYRLLKDGISVSVPDAKHGGQTPRGCASSTGQVPSKTTSCSSVSSASLAAYIPVGLIWSASSTACRGWSSS